MHGAALKDLEPLACLVCSEDVILCEVKCLICQSERSVAAVWHCGVPGPFCGTSEVSEDAGAGC